MRQAYDRPDIHNCELSGNVYELNAYQTVYVINGRPQSTRLMN